MGSRSLLKGILQTQVSRITGRFFTSWATGEAQSLSWIQLLQPCGCSPPAASVQGISQEDYCSGEPFSSPGYLPTPGIEPEPPSLAGQFFTTEPPGKSIKLKVTSKLKKEWGRTCFSDTETCLSSSRCVGVSKPARGQNMKAPVRHLFTGAWYVAGVAFWISKEKIN